MARVGCGGWRVRVRVRVRFRVGVRFGFKVKGLAFKFKG
jgi:hypothetical protein